MGNLIPSQFNNDILFIISSDGKVHSCEVGFDQIIKTQNYIEFQFISDLFQPFDVDLTTGIACLWGSWDGLSTVISPTPNCEKSKTYG